MKRAITDPLRPNPRNKNSCNSYKRKELQSQAHIMDGSYQPAGIAAQRLVYWSIRDVQLKAPDVPVALFPKLDACRNPKTAVPD
jgi:hypothetical protein